MNPAANRVVSMRTATLLIGLVCLTSACAPLRVVERGRYEVVTVDTLESEGARLVPQMVGDGLIVLLEKGREVPLDLLLSSSLLTVKSTDGTVTAERDLYMLITGQGMMLSPDGKRFAPVQNQRSMKKLFGLDGGSFALGFGVTREEGAKVTVRVQAK